MATDLANQSTTPASNTSVSSVSIAEGCPPSNVNDGMRGIIAQAKGALLAVTGAGTANAQTITYAPVPDGYVSGWLYPFKAGATNTGATQVNVNSLGAKDVKTMFGGGKTALSGGEIVSGGFYVLYYDGTDLILTNPTGKSGEWELIATNAPSSAATSVFTGFNANRYRDYKIVIEKLVAQTDNVTLRLRTSTDGGSNYDSGASDYDWTVMNSGAAGTGQPTLYSYDAADTSMVITGGVTAGNAAGETLTVEILLINPGAAVACEAMWRGWFKNTSGDRITISGSGSRVAAANVDAVQISFSSDNIVSGTLKFYGQRL